MSLDEKGNVQPPPPPEPVNESFLPPSDWDRQNDSDTLILMLPGFRKEQMKVQVTSNRMLRLSGARKISENKIRQFRKEERLSDYHDTKGITAKFEAGMLYVRIPKLAKQKSPPPPPPTTTQQEPPKSQPPPPTQLIEPPKPQQKPTTTQQEPPKPQPPPTTQLIEPPKPQPLPTTTQQEPPPKPQQKPTTDRKPEAPQQHVDEKDHTKKEDRGEESKTQTQTPLVPQELPKPPHEDSQIKKKPHKEMGKAETEEKSKSTSQTREMYATAQKTLKEDHDEDSHQKKEKGKAETDGNNIEKGEAITSKAHGTSPNDNALSTISTVAKMIIDMVSGFILEVKKQNKVPQFVVLIILVLLIGIYIKSVIKSSFGGAINQEL